ncbi:hypothetical protein CALCODRAFT_495835 [Calocera cornea HHB12733]|uniref:MARVEL domain-containing protein n=1 Tax=Calocera cornea HHB12733 TaxID=1353952 RepID=A0A165G9Q9_9BASI|nr:hypothetical protein CALCODRAFT_495835 [Calocera cornea HHB12733]
MKIYAIGRLVLHALVLIFSIVLLGVSANLVALGNKYGLSLIWAQLALAVSVITLAVMIPVLVLDRVRRNALPSWTAAELGWNGVLWVLWLACAGYATNALQGLDCGSRSYEVLYLDYYLGKKGQAVCQQAQAIEALSWLNWIFLFALFWWLLITALVYHNASQGTVWMSSMSDYQPTGAGAAKGVDMGGEVPMAQTGYAGATPMAAGTLQQGMQQQQQPAYGYGAGMPPAAGTPATQYTQGTLATQGHVPPAGVAQV